MITLLMDGRQASQVAARVEGDNLWLTPQDLEAATGWHFGEGGLCQEDLCVTIPEAGREQWVRGGEVNLATLWQHLRRPVMHDGRATVWVFGGGSGERTEQLQNLVAPDFELPDWKGTLHRLSDYRGKRVLLVTWASW